MFRAVFSAVVLFAASANGWREEGHMFVALVAQRQLTPEMTTLLTKMLAGPSGTYSLYGMKDIASAAAWPDILKTTAYDGRPKVLFDDRHFLDKPYYLESEVPATFETGKIEILGGNGKALEDPTLKVLENRLVFYKNSGLKSKLDATGILGAFAEYRPIGSVDKAAKLLLNEHSKKKGENSHRFFVKCVTWFKEHDLKLFEAQDPKFFDSIRSKPDPEKILIVNNIYLRLLEHVVGDVHQPLHNIEGFDPRMRLNKDHQLGIDTGMPAIGDKGGLEIKFPFGFELPGNLKAKHLHDLWDNAADALPVGLAAASPLTHGLTSLPETWNKKIAALKAIERSRYKTVPDPTIFGATAITACWEDLNTCNALIESWSDEARQVAIKFIYPVTIDALSRYGLFEETLSRDGQLDSNKYKYFHAIFIRPTPAALKIWKSVAIRQLAYGGARLGYLLKLIAKTDMLPKVTHTNRGVLQGPHTTTKVVKAKRNSARSVVPNSARKKKSGADGKEA